MSRDTAQILSNLRAPPSNLFDTLNIKNEDFIPISSSKSGNSNTSLSLEIPFVSENQSGNSKPSSHRINRFGSPGGSRFDVKPVGSPKKKPGRRGKCRGCMKREGLLAADRNFRRTVVKTGGVVESTAGKMMALFAQLQQMCATGLPMAREVAKGASKLAADASLPPVGSNVLEID